MAVDGIFICMTDAPKTLLLVEASRCLRDALIPAELPSIGLQKKWEVATDCFLIEALAAGSLTASVKGGEAGSDLQLPQGVWDWSSLKRSSPFAIADEPVGVEIQGCDLSAVHTGQIAFEEWLLSIKGPQVIWVSDFIEEARAWNGIEDPRAVWDKVFLYFWTDPTCPLYLPKSKGMLLPNGLAAAPAGWKKRTAEQVHNELLIDGRADLQHRLLGWSAERIKQSVLERAHIFVFAKFDELLDETGLELADALEICQRQEWITPEMVRTSEVDHENPHDKHGAAGLNLSAGQAGEHRLHAPTQQARRRTREEVRHSAERVCAELKKRDWRLGVRECGRFLRAMEPTKTKADCEALLKEVLPPEWQSGGAPRKASGKVDYAELGQALEIPEDRIPNPPR